MSTISDNDLDNIFKDAAEKYETTFDDSAWKAMEGRLDPKGSGFTYFKTIGGIIGMFLLGAFLIWWYTPEGTSDRSALNTIKNSKTAIPGLKDLLSLRRNTEEPEIIMPRPPENGANRHILIDESASSKNTVSDIKGLTPEKHRKAGDSKVANRNKIATRVNIPAAERLKASSQPENEEQQQGFTAQNQNAELILNTDYPEFLQALGYIKLSQELGSGKMMKVEQQEQDDEAKSRAGNLALKILYSPDLTSVGYFKPDRPGSNFGLMAEYFIGNKWSIATGAIYSRKIYFTEEEQISGYYGSTHTTSRIDGDCRVIDIPLNISYYVKRSDNQSIFLSAGSSTYLMLKEDYNYTRINNGNEEEWSQEITNQNNHFFGLLNLSVGYERRIKGNLYLQIAPFLKAPIAGIGEGKVDLVSTGAFLNLKYQFR